MSTESNPFDAGDTLRSFSSNQEVFSRYSLKKIVGRGGMGVVWLAHDKKLDEDVALKFLPDGVRADTRALKDLVRETKRSRELTHFNIVRTHDLVEDDSSAAIVMEYVDGESMQAGRYQQPQEVYSAEVLIPYIGQVAKAIDYAHSVAKIVHRDLKPDNILLTREGVIKVTDFGVARSLSDTKSRVTMIGASAGTMSYMSPQQLMGERPDPADDIYALGATIYELLCGSPPFHSGDVTTQIMHKPPPSLSGERELISHERIPEHWETVINLCLSKDRADRPESAMEVYEQLNGSTMPVAVASVSSPAAVDAAPLVTPPVAERVSRASKPAVSASGKNSKKGLILCCLLLVFAIGACLVGMVMNQTNEPGEDELLANQQDLEEAITISEQPSESNAVDESAESVEPSGLVQAAQDAERDGDLLSAYSFYQKAQAQGDEVEDELRKLKDLRVTVHVKGAPRGSSVIVNGKAMGLTPTKLSLALGEHTIKVEKKGYSPARTALKLLIKGSDDKVLNEHWLKRDEGSVKLRANISRVEHTVKMISSEGDVGDELRAYGGTELNELPTGTYKIVASRNGLQDVTEIVKVKRGELTKSFSKFKYGGIAVSSKPANATILLDEMRVGTTPQTLRVLPPGRYLVEVSHDGYKTSKQYVDVRSDATIYNLPQISLKKSEDPHPKVAEVPEGRRFTVKGVGELVKYNAAQRMQFVAGFELYKMRDQKMSYLKEVEGPVSLEVAGELKHANKKYYLSNWSFGKIEEERYDAVSWMLPKDGKVDIKKGKVNDGSIDFSLRKSAIALSSFQRDCIKMNNARLAAGNSYPVVSIDKELAFYADNCVWFDKGKLTKEKLRAQIVKDRADDPVRKFSAVEYISLQQVVGKKGVFELKCDVKVQKRSRHGKDIKYSRRETLLITASKDSPFKVVSIKYKKL